MDSGTKRDIEKKAWEILQDAGLIKPPINVEDLIKHLKLHLDYYSLEDPGFITRLKHKFDVKTHKILDVVKRSKIVAAWFPESSKILIDNNLPERKKTFPQFHEIVHSILPWHKNFYLGDTAETLQPTYQDTLEHEANYGASELWFCGPVFRKQSLDFSLEWKSVPQLQKDFSTTLTTTLWKFVVTQNEKAVVGVVSVPPWKGNQLPSNCRYFIKSPMFEKYFSNVDAGLILAQIEAGITQKRGGIIGIYEVRCVDNNGKMHVFRGETFYNQHELLSLIVIK